MFNYKDLAENILSDLMGDGAVSDILLKLKIFASKKGDDELLNWVTHELEGYEDKPPKYRILNSALRVDVFVPFMGISRINFPVELIKDDAVRERLSNMPFNNPIAEIDSLCKETGGEGTVSMRVPVYAYNFMSEFINGDIQDARQYTSRAAVSQILVAVKSVMIDFLLKVSNEEDIDFNTFIKNNPNMKNNITINAGIVNTGSGDVNAQGSTTVIGNNNTINADNKNELLRILSEIDKLAATGQTNPEYEEISEEIKTELKKDNPTKSILKRCFQAIPAILTGIGTGIAANALSPLIASAIALL